MQSLRAWFVGVALTIVAIVAVYIWLDRSIASLVHGYIVPAHRAAFASLTRIPEFFIPIAVLMFLFVGFLVLTDRPLSKPYSAAFVCSVSLLFAEAIKNELKFVFGRTWPETWTNHNPSFIGDGVYGFNVFHAGSAYQSFPSGHMSAACAAMTVLWLYYPRWRGLYGILAVAVGVGLVGANYHFLSDVIAGTFVGISTGAIATAIWRARTDN